MKHIAALILCISAVSCGISAQAQERTGYIAPKLSHAGYGELNIVVPVTSAEPAVWQQKLGNISNALNAANTFGGQLQIKVVSYHAGIDLLKQKDNNIAKAIQELRAKGVQFLACNQTLKRMDIDYRTLNGVAESDIVPAGFLEVAWLQSQNYKVDPMN
jgi:intracellular sulfur oxidation DsrE/DsrF family protein